MIIVVDNDKNVQTKICTMFYKMGFNTVGSTYDDLRSHILGIPPECVLVANADQIENIYAYAMLFKREYPSVPFIVLRDSKRSQTNYFLLKKCFDRVIDESAYTTTVVSAMLKLLLDYTGIDYSSIIAGGANVRINLKSVMFFGCPIYVTPIEHLIVRYLILVSPRKVMAEELLQYCFHPSKSPRLNNVATHISTINKKAKQITGKNMILCRRNQGYYITDTKKQKLDF